MKRTLSALAAALILAAARPALAVDLMEAYNQARESDPQLAAAADQRRAVETRDDQALAPLLPQLSASASINRERFDNKNGPTNYATNERYGLELSQTVYNRELFVALDQADSRIAEAEANFQAARQDLMIRLSERYLEVLKARAQLEFVRADKKATNRQLEQARQRFEVGLIAVTDVREAQARYDQVRAQEIVAENEVDSAKEALAEVTGEVPANLADLASEIPLRTPTPDEMSDWVESARENNLRVRARRYAAEAARQQMQRQRSGHYPTVELVASSEQQDVNFGGIAAIERNDSLIGLQARVPLFQGFATTSSTEEARHQFHAAQDELDQAQRETVRATRDAYRGVVAQKEQVEALRAAVRSAETALEATEAGFEVGTRTIVDVLDAQRNLLRAQRDYHQSRYDYVIATLRLKQATGVLAVEDIQRVNGWLAKN